MTLHDDGIDTWTFGSARFACEVTPNKWQGWFTSQAIVSISPVLDSTQRYIDVGGVNFTQLTRDVAFDDAASRDAFLNMVGQTKTLSNGMGRSRSAVLVSAVYMNFKGPFYMAQATWEAL